MYLADLLNFAFEGASGMQKMKDIMDSLRANAPKRIAAWRFSLSPTIRRVMPRIQGQAAEKY
jgi:hypothetical protein